MGKNVATLKYTFLLFCFVFCFFEFVLIGLSEFGGFSLVNYTVIKDYIKEYLWSGE